MKIQGNVVGTTQKPEKVVVKATNLTQEQQKQARQNIGAISLDDVQFLAEDYRDLSRTVGENATKAQNTQNDLSVLEVKVETFEEQGFVFCGTEQTLTEAQQEQARANIGAANEKVIGNISSALDRIIAIQSELIGTITFTVWGDELTAAVGMTWAEWLDSEYNTSSMGWWYNSVGGYIADITDCGGIISPSGDAYVALTDIIIDGAVYGYGFV